MPQRKDYEFSRHIGALCVRANKNVHTLGEKLGIDPVELLRMINGYVVPTKAVIAGLAKELDSDPRYLEKLAAEIKPRLANAEPYTNRGDTEYCFKNNGPHQAARTT